MSLTDDALSKGGGLEQRIAKLQLLAKFLGVLIFSPNWNLIGSRSQDLSGVGGDTNTALASAMDEARMHMDCTVPIIPLKKFIEDGWKNLHLVVVIPWVVEFLHMARWDKVSLNSAFYQDVFILLRSIHKVMAHTVCNSSSSSYHTNMQLVVMQLESLFAEVVGLDVADRLPLMTLPPRITDCFSHITSLSSALDAASISNTSTVVASTAPTKLEAFDALPLYFSKGFFVCIMLLYGRIIPTCN